MQTRTLQKAGILFLCALLLPASFPAAAQSEDAANTNGNYFWCYGKARDVNRWGDQAKVGPIFSQPRSTDVEPVKQAFFKYLKDWGVVWEFDTACAGPFRSSAEANADRNKAMLGYLGRISADQIYMGQRYIEVVK